MNTPAPRHPPLSHALPVTRCHTRMMCLLLALGTVGKPDLLYPNNNFLSSFYLYIFFFLKLFSQILILASGWITRTHNQSTQSSVVIPPQGVQVAKKEELAMLNFLYELFGWVGKGMYAFSLGLENQIFLQYYVNWQSINRENDSYHRQQLTNPHWQKQSACRRNSLWLVVLQLTHKMQLEVAFDPPQQ